MTKTWIRGAAAALVVSWLGLGMTASAQETGAGPVGAAVSTVTVAANGEVAAEPDTASVRLGAVAEAKDASAAQKQLAATMQNVLAALKKLGVPERSIRTDTLSLSPIYAQPSPGPGGSEPGSPRIAGYRAVNVVTVQLGDLSMIGAVVDAGISAGANQLEGVSFGLRDDANARRQALTQAVHEARAEAEAIANALGMRVDGVATVTTEGYSTVPPRPYPLAKFAAEAATPVQPGQLEVSASVRATYYLENAGGR